MRQIELTQGMFAIVDDEDYEWLNQWRWQYTGGYARRTAYHGRDKDGKRIREVVYMHKLIMDCPDGMVVDHIDRNPLNNQRENLRVCTQKENMRNRSHQKARGYRGVTYHYKDTWLVRIVVDGITHRIGIFDDEKAGANAYNYYAKMYFGVFANLNDVPFMNYLNWKQHIVGKEGDTLERTN